MLQQSTFILVLLIVMIPAIGQADPRTDFNAWKTWVREALAGSISPSGAAYRITLKDGRIFEAVKTITDDTTEYIVRLEFGSVRYKEHEVAESTEVVSAEQKFLEALDQVVCIDSITALQNQKQAYGQSSTIVNALNWWILYLDPTDIKQQMELNISRKCPTCNGSGSVPDATSEQCSRCWGRGQLTCQFCNGNGQERCSNSCEKSEGLYMYENGRSVLATGKIPRTSTTWYEDASGRKQQKSKTTYTTCPTCRGTTWIRCARCRGSRMLTCTACSGKGYTGQMVTCPGCKGIPDFITPAGEIRYPFSSYHAPDAAADESRLSLEERVAGLRELLNRGLLTRAEYEKRLQSYEEIRTKMDRLRGALAAGLLSQEEYETKINQLLE